MIRYACPHCAAVSAAVNERRAGQPSVCRKCLAAHTIPADPALWLTESGDPLYPVATRTEPVAGPESAVPEPIVLAPIELRGPEVAPREPEPAPEPVRVTVLPRAPEPEPEPEFEPEAPAAAVAVATPPPPVAPPRPRPLPVPAPTPAPVPRRAPAPTQSANERYGEPVQQQTQADITAALTDALSSRMKPRARERRDLRPSTALWLLLTGVGLALALVALFLDAEYRSGVFAVAAVQVLAGYAWIVRLTSMRDTARGWACALPPLTFGYLAQYKYAKLRPLRFVVTGALLALIGFAVPALAPHLSGAFAKPEAPPAPVEPRPEAQSRLAQLKRYSEARSYDALLKLLADLAKSDPYHSADRADAPAIAVELKALCDHQLTDVKVRAMAAYARWDPPAARVVCLAAARAPSAEEREWALRLLPQWKDHEVARAVQALIGRPGSAESNRAKAALEEIGGPPAERAALALLNRAEDQPTKLTALVILEKVGGAEAVEKLRAYAGATDDPAVHNRALGTIAAIEARAKLPAP
jgi:hypothetical protein